MIVLGCQQSAWKPHQEDRDRNRGNWGAGGVTERSKDPSERWRRDERGSRQEKEQTKYLNKAVKSQSGTIMGTRIKSSAWINRNEPVRVGLYNKRDVLLVSHRIVSKWSHTILMCHFATLSFWLSELNVKFQLNSKGKIHPNTPLKGLNFYKAITRQPWHFFYCVFLKYECKKSFYYIPMSIRIW